MGPPDQASEPMPIVHVVFQAGARRRQAAGSADSGASVSLIDRRLAEQLGLQMTAPTMAVEAAGGTLEGHRVVLSLVVALPRGPLRIPEASFVVPERPLNGGLAILGRDSLLLHSEVRFAEWRRQLGFVRRAQRSGAVFATRSLAAQ